jgi:peptidoglycan-associated lipoprotein
MTIVTCTLGDEAYIRGQPEPTMCRGRKEEMNHWINPRKITTISSLVALMSFTLGCAQEKPAEAPAPASEPAPQKELPGQDPKQAEIQIEPKLAEACGITESDAYFSYNSAKVSSTADGLLAKLAECFTTGPLAGRTMGIVGHADPRGESEFNLTLGGQRSDNVSAALAGKGLPKGQMTTSSRGEIDATGQDEQTWAKDRKVEVFLVDE